MSTYYKNTKIETINATYYFRYSRNLFNIGNRHSHLQ